MRHRVRRGAGQAQPVREVYGGWVLIHRIIGNQKQLAGSCVSGLARLGPRIFIAAGLATGAGRAFRPAAASVALGRLAHRSSEPR